MTTAGVVAYDAADGMLSFSYAGHPPFLFKRAQKGSWSYLARCDDQVEGSGATMDLPLAVAADTIYRQHVIPAASGDRIFIYTDGVTEAPDPQGRLFDMERLNEVLNANARALLPDLKSAVVQALHRHPGHGLTHDDVTLIAVKVN